MVLCHRRSIGTLDGSMAPDALPSIGDGLTSPTNTSRLQSRPLSVRIAVGLLWAQLAVGMIGPWLILLPVAPDVLNHAIAASVLFGVLTISIYTPVYFALAEGRNWARLLLTLLSVLSIAIYAARPDYRHYAGFDGPYAGLALFGGICQLSALCLLFTRAASVWFRASRPADVRPPSN